MEIISIEVMTAKMSDFEVMMLKLGCLKVFKIFSVTNRTEAKVTRKVRKI